MLQLIASTIYFDTTGFDTIVTIVHALSVGGSEGQATKKTKNRCTKNEE